jgi:hypothetical protein
MHLRTSLPCIAFTFVVVDCITIADPTPARADDELHDHAEFTMGFLAGERRYADIPFSLVDGGGSSLVSNDAHAPFLHAPLDKVSVYGVRYDARLVVSFVRMTAGFDLPFAATGTSSSTYDIGGTPRTVSVDSLRPYELHFGIGVEAPTHQVVPFVDLLGGVHWVTASLLVDGQKVDYRATTFGFAARAGVRVQLREWFFAQLAGEIGLGGDIRWGGELSVGFSTF